MSVESFEPADSGFADRVRESFARQSFMGHLGATMESVEPGRVCIELPQNPNLLQQHGFFHAGAVVSVADSAGGYAAYSLFPATASVLSAEFKVNLLRPARGDRLMATGAVVKPGRTLTVCDLEVYAFDDDVARLCMKGLQTVARIDDRPDVNMG